MLREAPMPQLGLGLQHLWRWSALQPGGQCQQGPSWVSVQINAEPCTWDGWARHGYRMGSGWLGSSSAAKVLADNKLNTSEQGTLAAMKVNNTPGAGAIAEPAGNDSAFFPQVTSGYGIRTPAIRQSSCRDTSARSLGWLWSWWLEHNKQEEQRELSLCSLEMRRTRRILTAVFHYPSGAIW